MYKTKYFSIEELVPKAILSKYGDSSWQFLDNRVLETIDFIREHLNRSITINNYKWGGRFQNRGYRSNLYKNNSLYASQHLHGRAIDFVVEDMSVVEVHKWLRMNQNKLPYPLWVEDIDGMNWVHIDIRQSDKGKLYFFKP